MMKIKDGLEIKLHLEAISQDSDFLLFIILHTEI